MRMFYFSFLCDEMVLLLHIEIIAYITGKKPEDALTFYCPSLKYYYTLYTSIKSSTKIQIYVC